MIVALCDALHRCGICPSLTPAGHGKTFSLAWIPGCSGDLLGGDPLHGRVRIHGVAETFGVQPLQHPRGRPGLLRLVVGPASRRGIGTGVEDVNEGTHNALAMVGILAAVPTEKEGFGLLKMIATKKPNK